MFYILSGSRLINWCMRVIRISLLIGEIHLLRLSTSLSVKLNVTWWTVAYAVSSARNTYIVVCCGNSIWRQHVTRNDILCHNCGVNTWRNYPLCDNMMWVLKRPLLKSLINSIRCNCITRPEGDRTQTYMDHLIKLRHNPCTTCRDVV